jgi:hypothetical protein
VSTVALAEGKQGDRLDFWEWKGMECSRPCFDIEIMVLDELSWVDDIFLVLA